jgi:hypothetical protein
MGCARLRAAASEFILYYYGSTVVRARQEAQPASAPSANATARQLSQVLTTDVDSDHAPRLRPRSGDVLPPAPLPWTRRPASSSWTTSAAASSSHTVSIPRLHRPRGLPCDPRPLRQDRMVPRARAGRVLGPFTSLREDGPSPAFAGTRPATRRCGPPSRPRGSRRWRR